MTHRLTTAKNYCNRTLIVKVIVGNVVTCFLGTQCTIEIVFAAGVRWIGFGLDVGRNTDTRR